jgi:hypothetical protein
MPISQEIRINKSARARCPNNNPNRKTVPTNKRGERRKEQNKRA